MEDWIQFLENEGDTTIKEVEAQKAPGIIGSKFWGSVYDQITGFFIAMFQTVWSGFIKMIAPAFFELNKSVATFMNETEDDFWEALTNAVASTGVLDKGTVQNLLKLEGLPFPFQSIFNATTLLLTMGNYVKEVGSIINTPGLRNLMKEISPNLPRPEEVMLGAFIAPEKTGEIREILRKSGISEEHIDLMFLSMYKMYNEDVIQMLFLRKIIDDDTMFMRMRELGYTDTRIKEIIKTWEIIPGPQDIIHMVAKEAFEPDMIQKMGLDDEFPGEQVQWLEKQGLSEDWAKKYWYAHWEQPSIQMGFEMLHRGIIGMAELDMLFRTVEIPPYWRDKLTAIAYQPFTRVDVRRMHKMGVINDEELVKSYMDLGYDDQKAYKMAEFTIMYNQGAEKSLTKTQILQGYKDKLMNRDDALEFIQDIGYSKTQAEYLVTLEDYKETKELQDELLDNIKLRFQNNFADEFQTVSQLNQLNLPAAQIDALMDKWKVKKIIDTKFPSKTDLDKMVKFKIIDMDTYKVEMEKLGYNFKYIDWFSKLVKKTGG